MRCNFELFGDIIDLDVIKSGTNSLLWPYFSMAIYGKMSKGCIGCEGILCGEQEGMYQFACNIISENAPTQPLPEGIVVAADGHLISN
jgi:predicted nucleic acid binding AN1-type Zn finger protein